MFDIFTWKMTEMINLKKSNLQAAKKVCRPGDNSVCGCSPILDYTHLIQFLYKNVHYWIFDL